MPDTIPAVAKSPLVAMDRIVNEDDRRPWEEQLEIVATYISEQGYELVPFDDQGNGFHLVLTPQDGFNELNKLGRKLNFDFSYSF